MIKRLLLVIVALSLLGAGCTKDGVSPLSNTKFPEICAGKELPKGFPEEMIHSDSVAITADSIGTGLEDRTTGKEYTQDGWMGSFCTELSKEEIISWYDKTLKEMGFNKQGEYDGEHIFIKGKTTVNVSAYDLEEGFALHSFNMMTANY